jgi:hypothetical protein
LPWPPALFLRVVSPPPSSQPTICQITVRDFPKRIQESACLEPRYYFCPVRAGS